MGYEIANTRANMLSRPETIISRKRKAETIIKEYERMPDDPVWWKVSAVSPVRDDEDNI
jgi:hypothetical protein